MIKENNNLIWIQKLDKIEQFKVYEVENTTIEIYQLSNKICAISNKISYHKSNITIFFEKLTKISNNEK